MDGSDAEGASLLPDSPRHECDANRSAAELSDCEAMWDEIAVVVEPGARPIPRAGQSPAADSRLERPPDRCRCDGIRRGNPADGEAVEPVVARRHEAVADIYRRGPNRRLETDARSK
jgi:hypothetical protein